jgi:hypothetical protein
MIVGMNSLQAHAAASQTHIDSDYRSSSNGGVLHDIYPAGLHYKTTTSG